MTEILNRQFRNAMRHIQHSFVVIVLCYGFVTNVLYEAYSFPLSPLAEKNLQEVILDNDSNNVLQHQFLSERNSFGFGGYMLTSAPIAYTLQPVVFSIGYERWLTPNSSCEVSLRYTSVFFATPRMNIQVGLIRPNGQVLTASRYIAQRWLNTVWGTDIIWMTRPFLETIPQFRVGIGGAVDMMTSLASLDATTPGPFISLVDSNLAILARGEYKEQVYFGAAICSEYSVLSFGNSADLKIRLQMYVQTAWLPRRNSVDLLGGLLIGTSFRLHW